MRSPIKYFGSKYYMRKEILNHFPSTYKLYVEGFGGGGSILFSKEPTPLEVYNDLYDYVYSLFKCIQDKELFDKLYHRLSLTYYHKKIRDESKEFVKNNKFDDILNKAYYFLLYNRMSFNGNGSFSRILQIRKNMPKSARDLLAMIENLPYIHERLSKVIIENLHIIDLIKKYDKNNTFFYLDPPYLQETKSSTASYEETMTDKEHVEMLELIKNSKGKFLISGYESNLYNNYLKEFELIKFKPNKKGKIECLWRNY